MATAKELLAFRSEGNHQVQRNLKYYNLDAIISIGYRVNTKRTVQSWQWATHFLQQNLEQGFS